jgi:hypothetical protein
VIHAFVEALADADLTRIDPSDDHPDLDLSWARLRLIHLYQVKDLNVAILVELDRARHRAPSSDVG